MALRFYNTMSRQLDEFKPIEDGKVRIYSCGPTVYDFPHIGNMRTFCFAGILRQFLKYKGYQVTQVMNLTDVDDKTIRQSRAEGISLREYTARYKKAFFEGLDTLKISRADRYPEATEHIPEMIAIIHKLMDNGLAYEADGSIYFKISAYPPYGKLSHMKMDQLKAGARVANDEYEKEQLSDFALWKGWDEEDGNVFWETDFGKGRPGWHIECSAMSMKYLGEHFDIHTSAVDNIFPHHENEIAQSEGATGKTFANYWMHAEHMLVEGRKMSKSLGNFYTINDIMDKGYSPLAIRFLYLNTHYRQQLNFTMKALEAAHNGLERYHDFISNLADVVSEENSGEVDQYIDKARTGFEEAMDEDLNTPRALGGVFDLIRDVNRLKAENRLSKSEAKKVLETIYGFDSVLGLKKDADEAIDAEIESLIQARIDARTNKNWTEADRIRDELLKQGIILEDSPGGTKWKRKL